MSEYVGICQNMSESSRHILWPPLNSFSIQPCSARFLMTYMITYTYITSLIWHSHIILPVSNICIQVWGCHILKIQKLHLSSIYVHLTRYLLHLSSPQKSVPHLQRPVNWASELLCALKSRQISKRRANSHQQPAEIQLIWNVRLFCPSCNGLHFPLIRMCLKSAERTCPQQIAG